MDDIWQLHPKFLDYEISTKGEIRSVRPRKGARANINNGIIKGWVQTVRPGYQRRLVALRKNGKTYIKKVHQLVLETFIEFCPPKHEACHINGNSLDNRIENLRWGTHVENIRDSIKHGTHKKPPIHKGETHPNATLTSLQVETIRDHCYKRGDQRKFAQQFKTSEETISRIRKRKTRLDG